MKAYYPAIHDFGSGTLFGFRLGGKHGDQCRCFERLAGESFELQAPRKRHPHDEYVFRRRKPGSDASAAIYLQYSAHGVLTKAALAFGGEPCSTSSIAESSAEKIRDYLLRRMGTESVAFERIAEWAIGPMRATFPRAAYVAAWVDSIHDQAVTRTARAGQGNARTMNASAYGAVIDSLTGSVTTGSISSANERVSALIVLTPAVV